MFPTDARLLLVRLAQNQGVKLRQSYTWWTSSLSSSSSAIPTPSSSSAPAGALKRLKTYLGRIIRNIAGKIGRRTDLLGKIALGRILVLARWGEAAQACARDKW